MSGKPIQQTKSFRPGVELTKIPPEVCEGFLRIVVPMLKRRDDIDVLASYKTKRQTWKDLRLRVAPKGTIAAERMQRESAMRRQQQLVQEQAALAVAGVGSGGRDGAWARQPSRSTLTPQEAMRYGNGNGNGAALRRSRTTTPESLARRAENGSPFGAEAGLSSLSSGGDAGIAQRTRRHSSSDSAMMQGVDQAALGLATPQQQQRQQQQQQRLSPRSDTRRRGSWSGGNVPGSGGLQQQQQQQQQQQVSSGRRLNLNRINSRLSQLRDA